MNDDSFDPVAGLLRRSGRRPAPPADRAARIRANVHAAWRADIDRRQRRNWLAAAASLLLVIGATSTAFMLRTPAVPEVIAHVATATGGATLVSGGQSRPVAAGGAVSVGDVLQVGASAGVTLAVDRPGTQASLRLAPGSIVAWNSADEVQLREGQLYLDIVSDRQGDHPALGVVAGGARIEHVGTRFMTSVEGSVVDVAVRDGSVRVRYAGSALTLGGGERAVLSAGTAERSSLAPADEAWEWAETLAAGIPLEGRSLLAVLRDLTTEAGLELRFSSVEVERQAAGTTLHGPPLRQPPRAALQSIMETTLFRLEGEPASGRVVLKLR